MNETIVVALLASLGAFIVTLVNALTSARKSQYDGLCRSLAALQNTVDELQDENRRLRNAVNELQGENMQLHAQIAKLERKLMQAYQRVEHLTGVLVENHLPVPDEVKEQ